MSVRILVVEDESAMAEMIEFNLVAEGYAVRTVADGMLALEVWRADRPDLVILDVMLPRMSGFEICRTARLAGLRTSVLFLSARGEAADRIEGLEAGADDYLNKPFHLRELLLRTANMLRRNAWLASTQVPEPEFSFAGYTIHFAAWTVILPSGQTEILSERETMMLKLFVERANMVVPREEILDRVWGENAFPSSRTVDNFVVRLRRILEPDPSTPQFLHTVWGVGYRFTPAGLEGL